MRKPLVVAIATIVLFSVSACGTSTPSTKNSTQDNKALVQRVTRLCSDLEAPELGVGTLCYDNGFRVTKDDFAFANWGRSLKADDNVTIQTLVDLFGHNAVCLEGNTNTCIMRPMTFQRLLEWNTALSGGRCEGLSTLSTRFSLDLDHPSQFGSAVDVHSINKSNKSLNEWTSHWWVTQFLPEVADRAAETRTQSPLQLVDDLIQGLIKKLGYTVGLYYHNVGHSVTPFAVTQRDDNFVIHVYDNNFPGERREILVNKLSNTWYYPKASQQIDGTAVNWKGTTGTLELTSMSSREGPFECRFCTNNPQLKNTTLTLASQDSNNPAYLRITTRDGSIIASPESVTNSISGAQYEVSKGGSAGLVTVTLPQTIGDYDIDIRRKDLTIPAGDAVLTLTRPEMASMQISGNLAASATTDTKNKTSLLAARSNSTEVFAPQNRTLRVSLAVGTHISRTSLAGGNSMVAYKVSNNTIEVSIKGANGKRSTPTPLNASSQTFVSDSALTLNDQGVVVVSESRIDAVPVRVAQTANFIPQVRQSTTTTVVAPPASIVISEPD